MCFFSCFSFILDVHTIYRLSSTAISIYIKSIKMIIVKIKCFLDCTVELAKRMFMRNIYFSPATLCKAYFKCINAAPIIIVFRNDSIDHAIIVEYGFKKVKWFFGIKLYFILREKKPNILMTP